MDRRPSGQFRSIDQAFDEARFGAERTLNLRASFPTAAEATRRADLWLRERQMAKAGEVLVITGRGAGPSTRPSRRSVGGMPSTWASVGAMSTTRAAPCCRPAANGRPQKITGTRAS